MAGRDFALKGSLDTATIFIEKKKVSSVVILFQSGHSSFSLFFNMRIGNKFLMAVNSTIRIGQYADNAAAMRAALEMALHCYPGYTFKPPTLAHTYYTLVLVRIGHTVWPYYIVLCTLSVK